MAGATATWPVLIPGPTEGRRPSWPKWLATQPVKITHQPHPFLIHLLTPEETDNGTFILSPRNVQILWPDAPAVIPLA